MWDKMTMYDSETNSVMEFGLVNLADDSDTPGLSTKPQAQEPDTLKEQEQLDEQEHEKISNYLAKYLPLYITGRQQVIENVKTWPDWVKIELSKTFDCVVTKVPAAVADWMSWIEKKAETSQTGSGEEGKETEK